MVYKNSIDNHIAMTGPSRGPLANDSYSSSANNIENIQPSLIDKIADWINAVDYPTKNALVKWLYGASKAKKSESTIEDPEQNQGAAQHAVQTLAYQLALRLPQQFCEQLLRSVESDPRTFSRSLDAQVTKLIFEPLGHV